MPFARLGHAVDHVLDVLVGLEGRGGRLAHRGVLRAPCLFLFSAGRGAGDHFPACLVILAISADVEPFSVVSSPILARQIFIV